MNIKRIIIFFISQLLMTHFSFADNGVDFEDTDPGMTYSSSSSVSLTLSSTAIPISVFITAASAFEKESERFNKCIGNDNTSNKDCLLDFFKNTEDSKQITSLYLLQGHDFEESLALGGGNTLNDLSELFSVKNSKMKKKFAQCLRKKRQNLIDINTQTIEQISTEVLLCGLDSHLKS
jgi:hypothetical protein